jgi:hypothetical protein
MSTLKLSLYKEHLGSEIENGVVARVQRFPSGEGENESLAATFQDVVIPAGRQATASLDVEPGRYRIQAFLPSGQVLQEDREIVAGEEAAVRFEPGSPARDWLGWQRFEGYEPDIGALTKAIPGLPGGWSRLTNLGSAILSFANVSGKGSEKPGAGGREPAASLSALSELGELGPAGLWAGLTGTDDPRPYFRTSKLQGTPPDITRQEDEGFVALWKVMRSDHFDSSPAWLLLEAADAIEIARLPLPWLDTRTGQFVEAEAVVDESPSHSGARLSLTVRDGTLGGLLAYLGRGAVPAARVLLDSLDQEGLITQTITAKQANPLAACAAAYAGLALFEPEEQERWDSWLPNIMNWFGWLPDGAIVHARRMILRPYQPDDREEALRALKTAYRAGIPYFSAGVQHLRDGLLLYAPRDEEAKAMLDTVSRLARRIDNGQIFTVIRYPKA